MSSFKEVLKYIWKILVLVVVTVFGILIFKKLDSSNEDKVNELENDIKNIDKEIEIKKRKKDKSISNANKIAEKREIVENRIKKVKKSRELKKRVKKSKDILNGYLNPDK